MFTIMLIMVCSLVGAQSLSVESFRLLETDLTANTYGTMERDQNGEVAALIKVVTSETGFVFDGGMMGIVKTEQRTGEIWVYVPRAIQKITITHQRYGVLRDYYFPLTIESARTYEMIMKLPYTAPVSNRNRAQYVVFNVEPRNAVVLVDNEAHTLNSEGQVSVRLNPGEHSYMVTAPSYETETGTVIVNDSRVTKDVRLSSLVGQLSVITDDDAEVYLNDEFVGIGPWSGNLNEGIYLVEVKRPTYKDVFQEVSVRRSDNREVSIYATEPTFGDLEVVSDPLDFDIYIDGQKQGVTPDYITSVRTGRHVVTLKKTAYFDREITVEIFEDSVSYLSVSNMQRIPESASDKRKREAQEARDAKAAARAAREAERENEIYEFDTISGTMGTKPVLEDVYDVADVMPVYPAGNAALVQYFKDNFVCPQYYKGSDRVIVAFVVEKDGYISHPYIVQGVDEIIDGEALRLVENMPRWTPGVNDGRIVRVWQTVNINIRSKQAKDRVSTASGSADKVNSSFYIGGRYGYANMASYGANLGFYLNNFNAEAEFVLHSQDLDGTWDMPSTYRSFCVYKWKIVNTASLKFGYGINIGRPVRLTPQVGLTLTRIKCIDDESLKRGQYLDQADYRTFCLGAQAEAKLDFVISDHMSVFVSPGYAIPVKMGERAILLDGEDKSVRKYIGGLRIGAGFSYIF